MHDRTPSITFTFMQKQLTLSVTTRTFGACVPEAMEADAGVGLAMMLATLENQMALAALGALAWPSP